MKFGDSFDRRSVPAWRSYNVDYQALKTLVKQCTTPQPGRAIDIPGASVDSAAVHFESHLLRLLALDIERASKFVKSKLFELDGRLASIHSQLAIVKERAPSRNSTGLQMRFARIESEILSVGEDLQSLSRFITSNRMAVRKLVKKYTKWTGIVTLQPKVDIIMGQPESFAQVRLSPLMHDYEKSLTEVRSVYEVHNGNRRPSSRRQMLAIAAARRSGRSDSAVLPASEFAAIDFDTAMDATPEAAVERRATFWIHRDHLVELRIALLQHLRQLVPTDHAAQLILSDRDSIAERVASGKVSPDCCVFVAADQAAVRVSAYGGPQQAARVSLADLSSFMREDGPWDKPRPVAADTSDAVGQRLAAEACQSTHDWIRTHSNVQLQAKAVYRRSRFVGLNDELGTNTRATLDEDITFIAQHQKSPLGQRSMFTTAEDFDRFPHAVLTVRYCDLDTVLVDTLVESHLAERVDEFSISMHAIWSTSSYPSIPAPSWLALLEKDIRHVPSPTTHTPSKRSSIFSNPADSRMNLQASGSSDSQIGSQSTRITVPSSGTDETPKTVMKQSKQRRPKRTLEQRYWNEYEDGELEDGGENAYVIYVDPNAPLFPGHHTLVRWKDNLSSLFSRKPKRSSISNGRVPFLDGEPESPTYYSSSDDEVNARDVSGEGREGRRIFASPQTRLNTSTRQNYSTFGAARSTSRATTQSHHTSPHSWRTTGICMISALIILGLLAVLEESSKRKFHKEVAGVTIAGAASSLAFAVIGVAAGLSTGRNRHLDAENFSRTRDRYDTTRSSRWSTVEAGTLLRISIVGILFVVVCVGNGWLLASSLDVAIAIDL